MLPYEDALAKLFAEARALPTLKLPLNDLLGYVLAEPVVARFDLPSFDNSAVDGYGVLVRDVEKATESNPIHLKLLGEMRAGAAENFELVPGTAIKILTGAIVPAGVEAVIMREYCEQRNGHGAPSTVLIKNRVHSGENIRRKGGEVSAGDQVLTPGKRITPPELGLIATVGESTAMVHAKPRVALVITGDELVPPGSELKAGQIFDSNSYALRAALQCLGIEACSVHYAKDSLGETQAAFEKAFAEADVVISSGGVSVGDHDYVKEALLNLNVETVFWQIAIKPGKPVFFGKLADTRQNSGKSAESAVQPKLIFGLPGNPVSVLITYHQFVKPALKKMMGVTDLTTVKYIARLTKSINKKAGRLDFMRGKLAPSDTAELSVTAVRGQDSHMLTGLSAADCLLHFAANAEVADANAEIPIEFLKWYD